MQKSSTIDFWLSSKYGPWRYCQKSTILKIFPKLCKTFFCLHSYRAYFILSVKSEKRVTERNKRQSIYWLTKPVFDSCRLGNLMPLILEFLSNGEGLDRFSRHVLPTLSKITVTCPKQVKRPNRMNFDLPQVSKININFELLKVSKMTSLKIYIYLQSWRS